MYMRALPPWMGVVAILMGLTVMSHATSAQESLTPSQDPVAGARLFETKGCVQCHAINGAGGKAGPDLGHVERSRSYYGLAAAMWNHVPQMAPRIRQSGAERPYLTSDEMSDLVAFLYKLRPGERLLDESGDAQRGQQIVADKGCLECHSLWPPKGKHAGSLNRLKGVGSPWAIIAMMWNHAFLMELKTEEVRGPWPTLSAGEMTDLVAFLRVHGYARDGQR
jgi:cytochrome c2